MSIRTEQTAWAIATNYVDTDGTATPYLGFLGRYWHFEGEVPLSDQHVLLTRLFATRAEARQKIKSMKSGAYVSFPHASVVKVKVTVEEQP